MPRIYLVVQNQVRTGPFTLEELLQQPLQPDAMVWIIGQSEDWLSPLEIPGLQGYFIQQQDGAITATESVLEEIRAKRFTAPAATPGTEAQRAGVLDAHLLEQPLPTTVTASSQSVFEEERPPYQPQVIAVPGAAQDASITAAGKAAAANQPPSGSEEDSITIARKNWAVVGIALVLVVFITWNALFNDDPRIKRNKEYAAAASALDARPSAPESTSAFSRTPSAEDIPAAEPVWEEKLPIVVPGYAAQQAQPASTDAFLDSVQQVLESQEQLMAEVDDVYRKSFLYKKRYSNTKPMARQSANVSGKSSYPSAQNKRETTKLPLSQQVDLQSRLVLDKHKQQVNSVELMVRNNSRQVLKTVSVDVYYYKKGEKLLNKETVYFSNLYPNQSLTKSIAGNQRATSARFQLGAITPVN